MGQHGKQRTGEHVYQDMKKTGQGKEVHADDQSGHWSKKAVQLMGEMSILEWTDWFVFLQESPSCMRAIFRCLAASRCSSFMMLSRFAPCPEG
jgi:hypothetical protein